MIDAQGICEVYPSSHGKRTAYGNHFTYSHDNWTVIMNLYSSISSMGRTILGRIIRSEPHNIKSCGIFFLEHMKPNCRTFEICFSNMEIE